MERRRTARRVPECHEGLSHLRLRTGRELAVLDVSNGGALVESSGRLLPGTHVDVHVVTRDGRVLVRTRVVRAYVSHVRSDAVRYRGALAFERLVDTLASVASTTIGYGFPSSTSAPAPRSGTLYPEAPDAEHPTLNEPLSA